MFVNACNQIRETIYGVMGLSVLATNQVAASNGTAFMIAPGIIATAAHLCHLNSDSTQPRHSQFEAIRSPDVGQSLEAATFIAEDTQRDIALLRLTSPRSNACVVLDVNRIPSGTPCGSLGFPLASVSFSQSGRLFNLVERFQSASVSAFISIAQSGQQLSQYETDSLMYPGSSGCPGFLENAKVFAMHVRSVMDQNAAQTSQTRISISRWVPASDIRDFARTNGISV
jgi:hypothetical protein